MGGDDPYADAVIYDLEYEGMAEDVGYYVQKARLARGPVLELGCGTGRITLPIARRGVTVHGVDAAPAMTARLRERLRSEPPDVQARVTVEDADYRRLAPATRFGAVLWPFNALHHCANGDEVGGVLRAARGWVGGRGFLALDCYLPDPELYGRDPTRRYEFRTFVHPRTGERLESWEQGWWDPERRVHHVVYTYQRPNGDQHRAHLELRMYELEELRAIVAGAGWTVQRETGDFEGRPVGSVGLKWVATLVPSP